MLKIALMAKAAKKAKKANPRAYYDDMDGIVVIFILVIAMLAAVIFIGCPVVGIIGAAKLISLETEAAHAMMAEGAVGALFNFFIGMMLVCMTIEENFFPFPGFYDYENAEVLEKKKKNRKGCLWLTLGGIAVTALIAGMVAIAAINMATNVVLAGVLFIILFSLSMVLIITGAVGKLFFT